MARGDGKGFARRNGCVSPNPRSTWASCERRRKRLGRCVPFSSMRRDCENVRSISGADSITLTCSAIFMESHRSSPSRKATYAPAVSRMPVFLAAAEPLPAVRRTLSRSSRMPVRSSGVPSTEPSSTTTISERGVRLAKRRAHRRLDELLRVADRHHHRNRRTLHRLPWALAILLRQHALHARRPGSTRSLIMMPAALPVVSLPASLKVARLRRQSSLSRELS